MKNIYYFQSIQHIGGIETFFRELSKKYNDWDITFYYQNADIEQLNQIKKYCRCIQFNPKNPVKVKCDNAFFNFNLDMLPYVEAKEKILVVHGNYKNLDGPPPQDKRITKVLAVSKDSAEAYEELTGIKCDVIYNPLSFEEYDEEIRIICACRLEDPVKGAKRVQKFVDAMDRYSAMYNRRYTLEIFTNSGTINSDNVIVRKSILDIRPYMKSAHYLLQLSDNFEGYCYSVNEMLYLFKKPVIITPCAVFNELGIDESMAIYINFDMSNLEEVVYKIFNSKFDVNYEPPIDDWDKVLAKGNSTYKEEIKDMVNVRCVVTFNDIDKETNKKTIRQVGEEFFVTEDRAKELLDSTKPGGALVVLADEPKKEVVKEETKKTTQTKKKKIATKK